MGILLIFVNSQGAIDKKSTDFTLYAPFKKADGLMPGADVRVAGIQVGRVVDQSLDPDYRVRVKMAFTKPIDLSLDSAAVIETDGLLGAKYIEIMPGGEDENLASGDSIDYTQDALILNELMDKVNAYMREKKDVTEAEVDAHIEEGE